jgi:hypothetical protein
MIKIKDKTQLCKKLGYNDIAPCIEKINYLEKHGIEEYLKRNFKYDFVLGAEMFLKELIKLYGENEDKEKFEKIREKLSRKPGLLYVNTNFKRNSEPIFVLAAMSSLRNITIDRKNFENKDEELKFISNFIRNHYKNNNGKLKMWGKISNYIYKSEWFDKYLVFDIKGNIIEEIENFTPSNAAIKV